MQPACNGHSPFLFTALTEGNQGPISESISEVDAMMNKNSICIWYDGTVKAVHRGPGDYPTGKQGDVLTMAAIEAARRG
jgi:hypothetical protein